MSDTSAILIFAKAPLPGQVKTRLIPALGSDGAAYLARLLLNLAITESLATTATRIILAQSPTPDDAAWQSVHLPGVLERWDQGGGDLGERLARCAAQALASYDKVLLIGSDAPALTTEWLDNALELLGETDAVMTPARDGGYALLGLTRFERSLFEDMPWSTNAVAARTRERLAAARLEWRETEPVTDIDEPADLDALPLPLREPLASYEDLRAKSGNIAGGN